MEQRHLDKIEVVGDHWLWQGHLDHKGYGRTTTGSRRVQAHRLIYEALRGPIPEGLTLDHLCEYNDCVNPSHLEPVTARENTQRAWKRRGGVRSTTYGMGRKSKPAISET